MYSINKLVSLMMILVTLMVETSSFASEAAKNVKVVNGYVVVGGKVTDISAHLLTIDGNQYPISKYVKVFRDGGQISFKVIHDVGKIDSAELYILGGKVEKIIVLKNL